MFEIVEVAFYVPIRIRNVLRNMRRSINITYILGPTQYVRTNKYLRSIRSCTEKTSLFEGIGGSPKKVTNSRTDRRGYLVVKVT